MCHGCFFPNPVQFSIHSHPIIPRLTTYEAEKSPLYNQTIDQCHSQGILCKTLLKFFESPAMKCYRGYNFQVIKIT